MKKNTYGDVPRSFWNTLSIGEQNYRYYYVKYERPRSPSIMSQSQFKFERKSGGVSRKLKQAGNVSKIREFELEKVTNFASHVTHSSSCYSSVCSAVAFYSKGK